MPCFFLGFTLFMWSLCLNLQVSMLSMFMAWFTCSMLVYMPNSMLVPRFMGPYVLMPSLEKRKGKPPLRAFAWPPIVATLLSMRGLVESPYRMMDGCVCVCVMVCGVVHMGLLVLSLSLSLSLFLSLSRWRKVGLPLLLWQESRLNFMGLPKASGIATNYWIFLKWD